LQPGEARHLLALVDAGHELRTKANHADEVAVPPQASERGPYTVPPSGSLK